MIKGVYDANTKHQSNPLYATLPRSEKGVRPQMRGDLLEHYNQLNKRRRKERRKERELSGLRPAPNGE